LDAVSYQGSISITNQVTGARLTVPVTLTLIPAAVTGGQISQNGVLNAASSQNAPVAPGEMVTIYGSGIGPSTLTTYSISPDGTLVNVLAETRVLFDSTAAPLVYVSAGQVSAIVPYGVSGKSSTQLQVEYKGVKSNAVSLPVAACAPAIFTADSSGKGQGSITNQDVSFNSKTNPADKTSVITFFATGEGQTDPPGSDGKLANSVFPKPILPVSVKIGGLDAEVVYYGAAPLAVAGLMQVNARVPDGLAPGDQPLVLQVGQCSSPDEVTVAVR
jgi:uncharacterized protein (TIGR03437 family)